ncbi:ribonuclease H-like domain-containing protein, partial [Fomitopsis betulina]
GRVLDQEATRVADRVKTEVKGRYATGQCDGWKNISKDHIIASIINAEYMTYLITTFCITKEQKNMENLLELVVGQIKYFTEVLQVTVVAWCTGTSGDGSKMRHLLVQRMPWLFVVDCWAHQINLVTGDVFKHVSAMFKDLLDNALEIIKWFNNHTRALGMLKDTMIVKLGKAVCLILPVITRWTLHYLAVRRLIGAECTFLQLLLDREDELVLCAGDKEPVWRKAEEVISKLRQPAFFDRLKCLSQHLAPLAIATNLFQSDHTRLDIVLITLANLYHIFSNPDLKQSDQAIFILAVVFNPYIRVSAFLRTSPFRKPNKIQNLAAEAFRRFYQCEPNNEFMVNVTEYLNWLGPYSDKRMGLACFKQDAKTKGTHVNLVDVWRNKVPIEDDIDDLSIPKPPHNGAAGFACLALHIASIIPNTASTERMFSFFKLVHTAIHNRISHEKVQKQAMVRADVMCMHPMQPRGQKRTFGDDLEPE